MTSEKIQVFIGYKPLVCLRGCRAEPDSDSLDQTVSKIKTALTTLEEIAAHAPHKEHMRLRQTDYNGIEVIYTEQLEYGNTGEQVHNLCEVLNYFLQLPVEHQPQTMYVSIPEIYREIVEAQLNKYKKTVDTSKTKERSLRMRIAYAMDTMFGIYYVRDMKK